MTTGMDGETLFDNSTTSSDGTNAFSLKLTFTRSADDVDDAGAPTDYTDAAIRLNFYDSQGDTTTLLALSIGTGLVRLTNAADSQVIKLNLSPNNLWTLRNQKSKNDIYYNWTIQPSGAQPVNKPKGKGYDGILTVCLESKAGSNNLY